MNVIPDSILTLCNNVPIDNTYKHTIYFGSKSSQQSYFAGKKKYSFTDYSYIREHQTIRVPLKADLLFDCNYMMYQNTSFGTKWFYAFITNVEYVNNECSEVTFEIDVMQTWLINTDYTIKPSFVEREHVSDDRIGFNLIEEGLETGEYIIYDTQESVGTTNGTDEIDMFGIGYIIAVSDNSPTGSTTQIGGLHNRVYSGLEYWFFDNNTADDMKNFIMNYITAGKSNAIIFIACIPKFCCTAEPGTKVGMLDEQGYFKVEINQPPSIDGYQPKNNKLFTYPYNLLFVTNNQGTGTPYRYELFGKIGTELSVKFMIGGIIGPNPVIMAYPLNYKIGEQQINQDKDIINPDYALSIQGYPLCSWTDDLYKAWLVQNGTYTAINIGASAISAIGGAISGNPLVTAGGVLGVINQIQQVYKASLQPDAAKGNVNSSSINIFMGYQQFYFQKMQIRQEYAKKIDDFFSYYGYKVNAFKVPNINTRPHWNYVKTIDICITGSVPANDMKKIQKIYDDGITIWKNGSEVGNYNLDNKIGG